MVFVIAAAVDLFSSCRPVTGVRVTRTCESKKFPIAADLLRRRNIVRRPSSCNSFRSTRLHRLLLGQLISTRRYHPRLPGDDSYRRAHADNYRAHVDLAIFFMCAAPSSPSRIFEASEDALDIPARTPDNAKLTKHGPITTQVTNIHPLCRNAAGGRRGPHGRSLNYYCSLAIRSNQPIRARSASRRQWEVDPKP